MRTITLTSGLCLALLSSIAFAQEPGPFNEQDLSYNTPDTMDNYIATEAPLPELPNKYIGLQVGGDYSKLKFSNSINFIGATQTVENSKNTGSIIGGLFGGYGLNFDHFYAGGEISLNYNSLSKSNSISLQTPLFSPTTKLTFKQPVVATADFIPGFLTRPCGTLFYGRIGVAGAFTQLKLNADSTTTPNSISDTTNKFTGGVRVGAGIDFYLVDWFSIRTDYVYTVYSKIKNTYTSTTMPLSYEYSVTPTSNQLSLGLNFHW